MLEKLNSEIKEAMKNKDKDRLNALRYLKSMLMENKTSTHPKPELDIAISVCKKLKDSLSNYAPETETRLKLEKEIDIMSEYLPKPLEESDVVDLILKIKEGLEKPNMGLIMKELSPHIKGKFDGKKASQLVLESLK